MDRLTGQISALQRAIDQIITLILTNSLYWLLLLILMGVITIMLRRIYLQNAAMLVDSSGWASLGGCRFNQLANGRYEVITPEHGLRIVGSDALLQGLLRKHFDKRGLPFPLVQYDTLRKKTSFN
jgi:hypothetical protein